MCNRCVLWTMLLFVCLGLAYLAAGCQSRPNIEDLGELEFAVPDLPGLHEPYVFPDGTKAKDPFTGEDPTDASRP